MQFGHELDPDRASGIAYNLLKRYKRMNEVSDLENSIKLFRRATQLVPDSYHSKPRWLDALGYCLLRLFRHSGDVDSLDHCIAAYREGVELTPDGNPGLSVRLFNLANAFRARFDRFGVSHDLEGALSADERAVSLTPIDDPALPQRLGNLAISLRTRFNCSGQPNDLNSALDAQRRAVDLTSSNDCQLPRRLVHLAATLGARFNRFGEPTDLDNAVDAHHRAVDLTSNKDPQLVQRLSHLATSFRTRFDRFGNARDLENALNTHRRALTSIDASRLIRRLSNLAGCLSNRFERFGELTDLEGALDAHRRIIALMSSDDPELPRRLSRLARSFRARFRRFGEPHDLECALDANRRAIELTPRDDPALPRWLFRLSLSLWTRFDTFCDPKDLESAHEAAYRAVELMPGDDPKLPALLSILAATLYSRFELLGQSHDLENAVDAHQRAVELTPDDSPELPQHLGNLAWSLHARFKRFGEPHNLEKALVAARRSVSLTPEGHRYRTQGMQALGLCLYSSFVYESTQENFNAAVNCYMVAAGQPLSHPYRRLRSAETCIRILSDHPEFPSSRGSLLLAYSCIIDSLPELVWLGHSVHRRFKESARIGGLVNAAVSAAIEADDLSRAVEWLEAGRSLIWSQVASVRTSLNDLAEHYPELAHALNEVHITLQQQADIDDQPDTPAAITQDSLAHVYVESAAEQYRRVVIRYDDLVKEIRTRDGFEDFMRPQKLPGLTSSPVFTRLRGAVIFVNVAHSSSDALILLPSCSVELVKLPGLSKHRAEKLRTLWTEKIALHRAHRRGMETWESSLVRGCFSTYALILGRLWAWVVRPILQALGKLLPHVIWCPTGPLTQLPLHAAGIYNQKQPGQRVFDFVVSSYTPSLSTLLRCLEKTGDHNTSPSMLLVAQTDTPRPGLNLLPHVRDESTSLRAILHGDEHTFLEDEQATVESVLSAITRHTWVHFACHGSQNSHDPTLTSVELHDRPLTLADLMKTVSTEAELAFLSACETAVGDQKVPEESAHLAAGMLAVGFKGVVATMWSIYDEDAPVVVDSYYKELLDLRASGTVPVGHTGAAYALHHAVECLRGKVGESKFERWVPFVHFGV
ncbi:hypothetical protein PENSPDRAFT_631053 [Peniophora sp. CONT]|nr:hypothetical protein PENSPDRAFT_631053 [Peniophora sp. CONT]